MDIGSVIQNLGISALLFGALAWVAKAVANRWLDSRVELFKAELRRDSFERQIRFESLHQRRARATLLIWRALKHAKNSFGAFVHPAQSGGEQQQDAQSKVAQDDILKLNKLVFENLIFFPSTLAQRVENCALGLDRLWFGAAFDYGDARQAKKNPYFDNQGRKSEFGLAWPKIQTDIDPLVAELESEFRKLLGVD